MRNSKTISPKGDFPGHYKNKDKGRIVEGIPNSEGSGHLYELSYKSVRSALEDVREQSAALFSATINHIRDVREMSAQDKKRVSDILAPKGIALEGDVTKAIVKDWVTNSTQLKSSYEPVYCVNLGSPKTHATYLDTADKIEQFRDEIPEFAADLDRLILSGRGDALVNPNYWYQETHDASDRKVCSQFERAVSSHVRGCDLASARAYVRKAPAQVQEITAE